MSTIAARLTALRGAWLSWFAGGAAVAVAVAVVALDLPPLAMAAAPVGLGLALVVIVQPFVGLVAVVFSSQVGGLLAKYVPLLGDSVIEVMALLVIVGLLANSHRQPRAERFGPDVLPMRLAVLFLLVVFISALFAGDQDQAMDGLRKRLNLVILMWLIVRMTDSMSRLRTLILALVLATLVSTGLAVAGYATGERVVAPERRTERDVDPGRVRQVGAASQNATTASRMMLAGTALAAVIAIRSARRRRIFATAAVVGALGTVLTFSRSTTLVMVLAVSWFLFKLRHHRRFPLVIAAAALVVVVFVSFMPAFYWERLGQLNASGEDPTLGRRLGYQLIGLDLLQSHPLLGVGPENYRVHYVDFDYRFMPGRYLEGRDLHNMFLSVAVETGLLGLACFLGMFVTAIVTLARVARRRIGTEIGVYAEAIQFALVIFLVSALFGAVETNKVLWVMTGLAISTGVVAGRLQRDAEPVAVTAGGPRSIPRGPR